MHFKKWALIPAALFAVAWAVIRAAKQSVTLDEAYTYLHFVVTPLKTVWSSSPNNHVLNTLLIRIVTGIFGTSAVALRAPALLGAILYIFCVGPLQTGLGCNSRFSFAWCTTR